MALPDTSAAYEDCFEYFEQAKRAAKGIRLLFDNEREAGMMRMRLNNARVIQRRETQRLFSRDDPRHGKSEFDSLKCVVKPSAEEDGKFWVYIEPWTLAVIDVEEIE